MSAATGIDWAAEIAAIDAKREAEYAAKMAKARATCHIRKRASCSMGNQFYSHRHRAQFRADYIDPQSQTLCGGDATIADLSWAETRYQKARADVACALCVQIREASA